MHSLSTHWNLHALAAAAACLPPAVGRLESATSCDYLPVPDFRQGNFFLLLGNELVCYSMLMPEQSPGRIIKLTFPSLSLRPDTCPDAIKSLFGWTVKL